MSSYQYVACACGGRKWYRAEMCKQCRYPNAVFGGKFECPDCHGPKSYQAKRCQFCWGPHRRSPTRALPRRMQLELTSAVDESLDLLCRTWAVGRAAVIYRLVLAAAKETERRERSA